MHTARSSVVLSLRGLTKSYGDLLAVNDLSLDVFRGEVFGFLGPNGAGKTTTIRMICGLLTSDAGEVWLDGRSPQDDYGEYKKRIGLCPQNVVIWESLTCLEQLETIGRLYDLHPHAARKRSLELLEILGLAGRKHKQARTLSGGMKRRLNIALALVHDPELLILDEPQAELDPQSRVLVREYILSLASHKTVILSTHDMDEVDRMADRIAIIDRGRLLVLDTPESLKNRIGTGAILEIRLPEGQEDRVHQLLQTLPDSLHDLAYHQGTLRVAGIEPSDVLPPLLDGLRNTGIRIQDLTVRERTLEDVFIALTGRRLRE
jgi:ABC-2 type transport system ATP-binding protein